MVGPLGGTVVSPMAIEVPGGTPSAFCHSGDPATSTT